MFKSSGKETLSFFQTPASLALFGVHSHSWTSLCGSKKSDAPVGQACSWSWRPTWSTRTKNWKQDAPGEFELIERMVCGCLMTEKTHVCLGFPLSTYRNPVQNNLGMKKSSWVHIHEKSRDAADLVQSSNQELKWCFVTLSLAFLHFFLVFRI